jgi:hypothetical protein
MTSTNESTTAPIPRTALANKRILDRVQPKVDTSHVEAAGITRSVSLSSGEAKRLFLRCHQAFAVATNYVVSVGRKILQHEDVDKLEDELRGLIRQTKAEIQNATLQAQHLFKEKHIERPARYRADPLVIEVDIISSLTREFVEAYQGFDTLMPLIETLEIEGVITSGKMEEQKSRLKRRLLRISSAARMFESATRKKVAEAKRQAEEDRLQPTRRRRRTVDDDILPPADGDGDVLSTPVALAAAQTPSAEGGEPAVEPQPLVAAEG